MPAAYAGARGRGGQVPSYASKKLARRGRGWRAPGPPGASARPSRAAPVMGAGRGVADLLVRGRPGRGDGRVPAAGGHAERLTSGVASRPRRGWGRTEASALPLGQRHRRCRKCTRWRTANCASCPGRTRVARGAATRDRSRTFESRSPDRHPRFAGLLSNRRPTSPARSTHHPVHPRRTERPDDYAFTSSASLFRGQRGTSCSR